MTKFNRVGDRIVPQPKTFHIGVSTGFEYPVPITFYVSPEMLADEGVSNDDLCNLLFDDFRDAMGGQRRKLLEALRSDA